MFDDTYFNQSLFYNVLFQTLPSLPIIQRILSEIIVRRFIIIIWQFVCTGIPKTKCSMFHISISLFYHVLFQTLPSLPPILDNIFLIPCTCLKIITTIWIRLSVIRWYWSSTNKIIIRVQGRKFPLSSYSFI